MPYASNNYILALSSVDKTIKLWNIMITYKYMNTLIGHEGRIR